MKFTIALADLESLLNAVVSRPRKDDTLVLSACAGRVFIEYEGDGAGIDALVCNGGTVTFPAQKFGDLLETYKGTRFLTFEWGANGLRVPTGTATATPTSTPTATGYIHAHTIADAYSDTDTLRHTNAQPDAETCESESRQ